MKKNDMARIIAGATSIGFILFTPAMIAIPIAFWLICDFVPFKQKQGL